MYLEPFSDLALRVKMALKSFNNPFVPFQASPQPIFQETGLTGGVVQQIFDTEKTEGAGPVRLSRG